MMCHLHAYFYKKNHTTDSISSQTYKHTMVYAYGQIHASYLYADVIGTFVLLNYLTGDDILIVEDVGNFNDMTYTSGVDGKCYCVTQDIHRYHCIHLSNIK